MPVRPLLLVSSLALVLAAGSAFAQPPATGTNAQAPAATAQAQDARSSAAANDAANVVNAFMQALAGNQLEAARQYMTPGAIVIANGQVFATREAYIDGPAKGDAAALASVQRELLRRDATAGDMLAAVVSEKRLRPAGAAQNAPTEIVTETMLLARTDAGWKIAHIHWSGRHAR